MNSNRPININPLTIRLPIPALVSISHRISGFLLFFIIPFVLWMMDQSLQSAETFSNMAALMTSFWAQGILFVALSGLIFHVVAGVRHLLMDMHVADTLRASRATAFLTFMISGLLILATAYWIWG